jgi:hypothetical protein
MTIRRPIPPPPHRRPQPLRDRGAAAFVLLALAAAIALLAPGRSDGRPEDAAAEGIARAARCDPDLAAGARRWAACIERQRAGLAADPVAAAGLDFHAWRVAERATADGTPGAGPLRDAYRRPLAAALRDNLVSLHRLCTAAGTDCAPIESRLLPDDPPAQG